MPVSVMKVLALIVTVLTIIGNKLNSANAIPNAGANVSKILNKLLDRAYDKRVRPNYGGPPVEVGVTMYVIDISSVSENKMEFTADFYFRQTWKDKRLSFIPDRERDYIVAGSEVADKIWIPDTIFPNEKISLFHDITVPNIFLRISSSGEVFKSIRLTQTASCPMNLQYFPMDRQSCAIEMESYGFSMTDIVYNWAKSGASVGLSSYLSVLGFEVTGHNLLTKIEMLSNGNYSRLVLEIELQRSSFFYILHTYIPAILVVVMSWVSFWINRNAVTARVIIGVTTSLTIILLWSFTNSSLPKITYIKSIDIFLALCFLTAFASLLEFATIAFLHNTIELSHNQFTDHKNGCCVDENCNESDDANHIRCGNCNKMFSVCRISKFDTYSRILFPVCFVIFNLIYWLKFN